MNSVLFCSSKKTVTHLNHHHINIFLYRYVYQPMVRFGYGQEVDCLLSSSIANIAVSTHLSLNWLNTYFSIHFDTIISCGLCFSTHFFRGYSAVNVATNFVAIKSAVYIWEQLIFKSTFHSGRTVCKDQQEFKLYFTI